MLELESTSTPYWSTQWHLFKGSWDKAGIYDFDGGLGGLCSGQHVTKVFMHKAFMHRESGRKRVKDE